MFAIIDTPACPDRANKFSNDQQAAMLNIDLIRSQCPSCENLIHFNNAGSALAPDSVTESVVSHLRLEQSLGGYEAARQAEADIENFYSALSKLLNCQSSEIAYIENATRAWDLALYSIPLEPGDEIITFPCEYASNYMGLLHLCRQKQLKLTVAPLDDNGLVDLEKLAALVNKRSKVIALTHIASQRGDIQPAAEVGAVAKKHGLYFLLDACQSAGQVALDVESLHCDFLCGTGRKYLRGPRGTGFLYVSHKRLAGLEPIFVDLQAAQWQSADSFCWRQDARKFENWERFVAGVIGLGRAVDYACEIGLTAIESRIQKLATYLTTSLKNLERLEVLEKSSQRSGIVTLNKADEPTAHLQQRLASQGINTSVASASNARFDLNKEGIDQALRASLHYYNTEAEIDRFVEVLLEK